MSNNSKRLLNNFFRFVKGAGGMNTDHPVSSQPEGTYRTAWNVSNATTDEDAGDGVYNRAGMTYCASLPDGHIPRGDHFVEENDWLIVFSSKGGFSEIGYIDQNSCTYHKILNDGDGCTLDFGDDEWIPMVTKYIRNGSCYDLHLYWTNHTYYKTINVSRIKAPITCDDIALIRCHSIATAEVFASETGGDSLEGGVYQFAGQYEDEDGNVSNVYHFSHPVSIETENNRPGEISEQAIHVTFRDLSVHYSKINIFVAKTVGGVTTYHLISKSYYTTDKVTFVYRGTSQEIYTVSGAELNTPKNGWFRGFDIFQYDGVLMPYNLLGQENPNLYDITKKLKVKYRILGVPLEYAHLHSGMRHDEVYDIALQENYCDGTSSFAATIPGRKSNGGDTAMVPPGDENCQACPLPRWQVDNTATQTAVFCDNPSTISIQEEEINYDTGTPIYTPVVEDPDPISDEDSGFPTDDDLKKAAEEGKGKQMECMCKKLAPVFLQYGLNATQTGKDGNWINKIVSFFERFAPKVPPLHAFMLSDPVSVVTAWCGCQEEARKGKEEPPNNNSKDPAPGRDDAPKRDGNRDDDENKPDTDNPNNPDDNDPGNTNKCDGYPCANCACCEQTNPRSEGEPRVPCDCDCSIYSECCG